MSTVLYAAADGIARITMNRPAQHNALNHALLADLDAAFDAAEADRSVSVIVLSGAGKSFCSGYDTKGGSPYIDPPDGAEAWTGEAALTALRAIEARYMRIWNCPKITIAQVHGHALAAGCYLQLLCDISIAAESAQLGHPVRRPGITSMPLWQVALPLKLRDLEIEFARRGGGERGDDFLVEAVLAQAASQNSDGAGHEVILELGPPL